MPTEVLLSTSKAKEIVSSQCSLLPSESNYLTGKNILVILADPIINFNMKYIWEPQQNNYENFIHPPLAFDTRSALFNGQ